MSGNRKWKTAAIAAVGLAVLIGCGGEESVASKSAAAFEKAQKEGKVEGAGHDHGHDHGAPTPAPGAGDGHQHHGAAQEEQPASHGGSPADHSAMGHGGGQHAPEHGASQHAGHGSPARRPAAEGHDHGGHSQPAAPGQDHAGHSASGAEAPSRPMPEVPELPTQPAGILRPDPLDAPAATSVADAQRAAEMNQEMSGGTGGHGGHGAGDYRHVDAGRGPEAHEGSEPQPPGAGHEHHGQAAAVYACPIHPEVTSQTAGTCPKCGRKLVERREE